MEIEINVERDGERERLRHRDTEKGTDRQWRETQMQREKYSARETKMEKERDRQPVERETGMLRDNIEREQLKRRKRETARHSRARERRREINIEPGPERERERETDSETDLRVLFERL